MVAVRTILTALIAISIVILPATGEAAVSTSPVEISMSDNADMPCCPCCNDQDLSKMPVACALKCISFVGVILPATAVIHLCLVDVTRASFANGALHEYSSSPPTHPPPI